MPLIKIKWWWCLKQDQNGNSKNPLAFASIPMHALYTISVERIWSAYNVVSITPHFPFTSSSNIPSPRSGKKYSNKLLNKNYISTVISHRKTFRTMSYSIYFLFLHIFFWHVYWNENNLNWKNRISFKRKNLNSKNNTVSPEKMHAKEASDDGRENISIFYPEISIHFSSPRSGTREILTAQHARGG